MRRYGLKGLEIFHGFLLLSAFYCGVMQAVNRQAGTVFYKSLIFIPVVAVLSISIKKVRFLWQYFLLALFGGILAVLAAGQGFSGILVGTCVGGAAISYFIARAKGENCWLDIPVYPWLIIYLALYLLGSHLENDFLMKYSSMGAGLYFLTVNFYINLKETEIFVRTHSSLERLPVKRLGRINQGMMWMLTGITVAAMIASPHLGIEEMIRQAGRAIRWVIAWLFSLLPSGGTVALETAAESAPQMPMGESGAPSAFWVLFYKLLDLLGWMLAIGLVLLVIWLVLKRIYLLYRSFYTHTEDNGDKIERLIASPSMVKKRNLAREKKENLFWDRSADARIRKYYKKKVLHDLQEAPLPFWTPSQMEEGVELPEEDKKKFHDYYEKARYAKENCSREEMQEMLNLR
ncbi:MAG: hypothetical protein KH828_12185 [Clostridiales bacterium]|nr:hypothetical protein [Clostridiales bacterium]